MQNGHTHGTELNKELIKEKIKVVMDTLGIDRMPTNKEIMLVMDN